MALLPFQIMETVVSETLNFSGNYIVNSSKVASKRNSSFYFLIRSVFVASVTLCTDRIVSGWHWDVQEAELAVEDCSKALPPRSSLVLRNRQTLLKKRRINMRYLHKSREITACRESFIRLSSVRPFIHISRLWDVEC